MQEKVEDERLGGATLADAAKKFGLTPRTIERSTAPARTPRATPSPTCRRMSMCSRPPSAPTFTARTSRCACRNNGGYVWFDVEQITPARDQPLDEVKDEVVKRWRDDEITNRLRTKATEMLDKIKAGTSFADVAAADKLKVEWRPGIKRSRAAARPVGRRRRRSLQDPAGRRRHRRRHHADRADRVPRDRDQGAAARSGSG